MKHQETLSPLDLNHICSTFKAKSSKLFELLRHTYHTRLCGTIVNDTFCRLFDYLIRRFPITFTTYCLRTEKFARENSKT